MEKSGQKTLSHGAYTQGNRILFFKNPLIRRLLASRSGAGLERHKGDKSGLRSVPGPMPEGVPTWAIAGQLCCEDSVWEGGS